MSKRSQEIYKQYRRLNNLGWNIPHTTNHVHFNGGSEKLSHQVAKVVAANVCLNADYRVASEVETDQGDEADILAYGHESRRPIVIEVENGLTEDTREKKREQYDIGVREVFIIDLDNAPSDPDELREHIKDKTGL